MIRKGWKSISAVCLLRWGNRYRDETINKGNMSMNIKTGSNLAKVRKNNYAAILATIYQQGPITRNEIAKQLDVTLPTVTTTIKQLLGEGILKEVPIQEPGNALGRRAAAVDFEENAGYAAGIEWSPVGIIACITNLRGQMVAKRKKLMKRVAVPYIDMLYGTRQCLDELIQESGIDRGKIIGAGWATPGMVEPDEGVLVCSSMDGVVWHDEPVRKSLEVLLELPVCIENHVRVRAIGQDMFERRKRPEVYLYYFAQMGISCCVMSEGEPFGKGKAGTGDIGHTVMDIDGPLCICGRQGCLQAFIGETALVNAARDLLRQGRADTLRQLCSNPGAPEVMELAMAIDCGDDDLKEIVFPAIRYMGISIGNIVNLLNSQLVVIDCALLNSQVLKRYLDEIIYESNIFKAELELKTEYLNANRYTGAQGACALAIREFLIGRNVVEMDGK